MQIVIFFISLFYSKILEFCFALNNLDCQLLKHSFSPFFLIIYGYKCKYKDIYMYMR